MKRGKAAEPLRFFSSIFFRAKGRARRPRACPRRQSQRPTLFSQHGFRRATCRDGISVAVDELPASADFLVNARHARSESREVRARAQLCAIMFDLDKNDDLLVAIDRDAIDRDNRAILIFGRRVVERLQQSGSVCTIRRTWAGCGPDKGNRD